MRIRRTIVLGGAFCALLIVVGVSAFSIWRNSINAQNRIAALHNSHLEAGLALASVRANVYLIGILTRDYLLDRDPTHTQQYEQQFAAVRAKIAADLQLLDKNTQEPQERAALDALRRGIDSYWDPTALVLNWTLEQRTLRGAPFLSQRVHRREEITKLAGQVEHLMTENYSGEQKRIATTNADFRNSLGWTAGICLLLSLGITIVTLVQMIALERRSERSEWELRKLSVQVRIAQEQERKYLSRELHDQVGQMLTGLRMELSSLQRWQGIPERERALRIAHAKEIVEQTLNLVRNIAMLLRPSMLDDLGLAPALAWLSKDISRTSGVAIEAHIDPALDALPDAHRTCLFRVAQEALTNVSRHSSAQKAAISVKREDGWVIGEISDDGQGFDATARQDGLGLIGIQERIRELSGQVQVASTPGLGTRIVFRLPIPLDMEKRNDSNPDCGRSRDRSGRVETSA